MNSLISPEFQYQYLYLVRLSGRDGIMKRHFVLLLSFFLFIMLQATYSFSVEPPVNAIGITPNIGGYVFEGDQNEDNGPMYGLGLEYIFNKNWSIEGAFNFIDSDSAAGDVDGYLYRVDGLYNFSSSNNLVPYLAIGLGGLTLDRDMGESDTDFLFEYGGGVKYFVTYNLALKGDIRHILSFNGHGNNLAYSLGLTFLFGGKTAEAVLPADTDGDGVYDSQDQCPNTPRDIKVDSRGCPLDSDGDGVYDYMDQCPHTPAGISVDKTGCPMDTDGDGVYDSQDQCPDTPKGTEVNSDGCPLDSDGDGVYDYMDQCPHTPAGISVDKTGCPMDTDGDGVYDSQDKCPDTPKGAKVDERGCWTLGGVLFDTDKWNIKPRFRSVLDDVVNVLRHNPGIKLEIQGYTDNRGSISHNMKLSLERAEAVRQYLISRGISPERLSAKGFGCSRPVASNDTPDGRAKNRRVELKPVY